MMTMKIFFLLQLDVNNLYDYSMCEMLSVENFQWDEPKHPKDYYNDGTKGLLLESRFRISRICTGSIQ